VLINFRWFYWHLYFWNKFFVVYIYLSFRIVSTNKFHTFYGREDNVGFFLGWWAILLEL
jgi:hypothetical protein